MVGGKKHHQVELTAVFLHVMSMRLLSELFICEYKKIFFFCCPDKMAPCAGA